MKWIENEILMRDIKALKNSVNIQRIEEGFSYDLKYKVTFSNENKLLRIYNLDIKNNVKFKLTQMKRFNELGVKCPNVYHYGEKDYYCYSITDFIEGVDVDKVFSQLTEIEQYHVGYDAGLDLKRIHQLKIDDLTGVRISTNNIERMLKRYFELNLDFPFAKEVIEYIHENVNITKNRPVVFIHNDFHARNIIVKDKKYSGIIDFNRCKMEDPYRDFTKLELFSTARSVPFSKGVVNGYFNNKIPDDFFTYRAYDMAVAVIGHLIWANDLFPEEKENAIETVNHVLNQYNHFHDTIPKWFKSSI